MRPIPALAALTLLAACGPEATEPFRLDPVEAVAARERLVNAYTGFGLDLFRRVADASGEGNVFLSPSSVAFALSMAANGAAGETREAMAAALGVQGMPLETLNAANRAWAEALARPEAAVRLTVANSLWARKGVPFREDFLRRTRDAYDAEVAALDFSDPSAARTINGWVSRSTDGKIREIVPASIDPQTVMYLVNAIYFRGEWSKAFQPELTREAPWHLPGGATRPQPMMHRDGTYPVLDGDGFTGVALPYGEGRVRMYILLPDEGVSLAELRGRLDAATWEGWMKGFREQRILLTVPRFRLEAEVGLVPALEALGMGVAFDAARADFGGMLPADFLARNPAFVSDVKHKTFLEVTEWGTVAAGVTSVEVGVTSLPPSVVVDRPFLLAIRDDRTGTVLFLGQIVDPR